MSSDVNVCSYHGQIIEHFPIVLVFLVSCRLNYQHFLVQVIEDACGYRCNDAIDGIKFKIRPDNGGRTRGNATALQNAEHHKLAYL